MATMVCHRSLDSQFIDAAAWPPINLEFLTFKSCFLNLDLDPSKSLNQCEDRNQIAVNSVLPPPPSAAAAAESTSPMAIKELEESAASYVHPLVKRSSSTLSEESLAICTEDLGSETGSADFVEDDGSVFSDLKSARCSPTWKRGKSGNRGTGRLFPPPLTTISGADSIRVRSYREDGRLIMEAVESPARLAYFHADRSHGRLRLSILKSTNPPEVEDERTEKEEELRIQNDDVEVVGEEGNYEEIKGGKVGRNGNFGGAEIEMEKILRACRCKEAGGNSNNIDGNRNNNGILLLTRAPLSIWVSTS